MIKPIDTAAILLRKIMGIMLCLVGLAGLVLPVMPGFVFIIPGLILLDAKLLLKKMHNFIK